MIPLLLLLAPFVQLGFSFYASMATALAVLAALLWLPSIRKMPVNLWAKLLLMAAMGLSVVASSSDVVWDSLRAGREALFFYLIATVFEQAPYFQTDGKRDYTNLALGVVGALSVLAVVQQVGSFSRQFIGLPIAWFSQNQATLPTLLDFTYSHIRPWGTFGEPSYFAFFLISVFVGFAPLAVSSARARWLLVLIVFCGLITQSLAFILLIGPISYFTFYQRMTLKERRRTLLIAGGVALVAASAGVISAVARFNSTGGVSQDASLYARVIVPAQIAFSYLLDHPAGSGWSELFSNLAFYSRSLGVNSKGITDNAFFSMLFCYGFVAVAIWVYFVLSIRSRALLVYLFACFMFNGALFSPDKFALMALALALNAQAEGLTQVSRLETTAASQTAGPSWRWRPAPRRGVGAHRPLKVRR